MRTTFDRIRQAISFELIGLAIVIPLGALVLDHGAGEIGAISVIGSLLATLWNYLYNLGFDHLLHWWRGSSEKTLPLRVVHALGFEGGLLLALAPIFGWWLTIPLAEAFAMGLGFAAFYLVYAFVFTWAYDTVFPVPARVRTTVPAPSGPDPSTAANATGSRSSCARGTC